MHGFETVLALLVGVTFLALLARRLDIPTPAVLVAGGLLVALVPGLPALQFDPQLVFLVFIPPLADPGKLERSVRATPGMGSGARELDGHRRARRVGVPRDLSAAVAESAPAAAGSVAPVAVPGCRCLGRPARRGVSRAGGRRSHADRRGYAVPGPRPDHRDHVRRDPRDPAGSGVHARAAVAVAGGAGDGRRGTARGDRGPAAGLEGRPRAARGARDGAMDASGDAGPHAGPLPPPHAAAARPGEGGGGRRRGGHLRRRRAARAGAARGRAAGATAAARRGGDQRRRDAARAARDRSRGATPRRRLTADPLRPVRSRARRRAPPEVPLPARGRAPIP